jgi:hypothetical protein
MLFLRAVESCLRAHSPGASAAARLGAVAFIHRFGSNLNAHLHFHCVVVDGVFDAAAGGLIFHAASGLDATAIADVQAGVRRWLLRVFARRGLLPGDDAQAMGQWAHGGGFSVDGSVRLEATDRGGRERLLRYCARPPFALDRLHERDPEHLLYESAKQGPGGNGLQIRAPRRPLTIAASRRSGQVKTCYGAPVGTSWRWTYCPQVQGQSTFHRGHVFTRDRLRVRRQAIEHQMERPLAILHHLL